MRRHERISHGRHFEEPYLRMVREANRPDPQKVDWAPLYDRDENGWLYCNYGLMEMKDRLKAARHRKKNGYLSVNEGFERIQWVAEMLAYSKKLEERNGSC